MSEHKLQRWEIKASTGNHFDVLDGLRGIAILLVIVFHTFYTNPTHSNFEAGVQYLIFSGWMGVPVFFVLSGFLISYPFFKEYVQDPRRWYPHGYALRRIGKILPPFYLSIAIFTLIYWYRFHDVNYLRAALRWATGLESYGLPLADFNLSYWSLMVEAHFYALLPLLFFLTRSLSFRNKCAVIVTTMLVVPLVLRLAAWPQGMATPPNNLTGSQISFFIQRFPLCLMDYFAFGVAFAGIYVALKSRPGDHRKLAALGYAGAVVLVLTLVYWACACQAYQVNDFPRRWSIETFKYLPSAATFLLLFFVFDPGCAGARLLSCGWLRFTGIISYEWFLFHGPIVRWFRDLFGHTSGDFKLYVGKTVLPLAITFVFSVLVYRYFSLPILNRVRESLKNKMSVSKIKEWEIKASTGNHFDVLDGLRGMAILLVVAYHTLYTNPDMGVISRMAGYIIAAGWMGVPIFFVLSGFLISYPFFQKRGANPRFWYQRGYASRRMAKILPPFYLSLLLFIGFYWLQGQDTSYVRSACLWAAGLGNFMVVEPLFNGSYWSLIVESQFYLVLPVLFWITRGQTVRTTTLLLFMILFCVPPVARLFIWPADCLVAPEYGDPAGRFFSMAQGRFPCQLDYFAWGVAFAGTYVALEPIREKLQPLGVFGYAGGALMLIALILWGYWDAVFDIRGHPTRWSVEVAHLLPALGAVLLLFFVFDPASLGARFFSLGWLRFTGIISYEWFLFHGPVVGWFHEHTGPSHGSLMAYAWRAIMPLVLTFLFSALVYRYFSLPILNRVRDKLKKV